MSMKANGVPVGDSLVEIENNIFSEWIKVPKKGEKSSGMLYSMLEEIWTQEALDMESYFAEARETLQETVGEIFGRSLSPVENISIYEESLNYYKKYGFSRTDCQPLLACNRVAIYNQQCAKHNPTLEKCQVQVGRAVYTVALLGVVFPFLEDAKVLPFGSAPMQYRLLPQGEKKISYTGEVMNPLRPMIAQANVAIEALEGKKTTFYVRKNILKELLLYCNHAEAPGNLIPVPVAYSGKRGSLGLGAFWDLTLMEIKEFYDGKLLEDRDLQKSALLNLAGIMLAQEEIPEASDRYLLNSLGQWLSQWADWEAFILENYLTMYVDLDSDDWAVLPLWSGHSGESWEMPLGKDFLHVLVECNRRIRERDRQMAEGS